MTAVLDLALDGLTERDAADVAALIAGKAFDQFADQLGRVGNCAHPVRLIGRSDTVDARTGELISIYSSEHESDGVTRIACGNRRASVCPACSRRYAADTWHLIHAGAAGGKGVPDTVATHPMVFATLTAPSFGSVHRADRAGQPCRPRRAKTLCPHGRPTWCTHRHATGDKQVGRPLCLECYDYASHVVWQWHAPELWRRFTITLSREVARHLGVRPSRLGEIASVQYAKVAEYQRRGVVHFHALIRLDGPKTPDGFASAPACITADDLCQLVQAALAKVRYDAPPTDTTDCTRRLAFGAQVDAHPVRSSTTGGDALTPAAVAGYIAKYATKTIDDPDTYDQRSPHHRRLRETVHELAERAGRHYLDEQDPYERLDHWQHTLGFRGHFATKSRKYSTTLGRLRRARQRWQTLAGEKRRNGRVVVELDLGDQADDDTTLVVRTWRYAGQGWTSDGQTALATAAAARAREQQQERARSRQSLNRQ